MLFSSISFLIFFIVVFSCYWFVLKKSIKLQNIFLLAASYFFYAFWDWRFLSLIVISSLSDFLIGRKIGITDNPKQRKHWLGVSIFINLSILGFFKYFNFFIDSLNELSQLLGIGFNVSTMYIILPVGISFYTFQTMSYTIDVYRKQIEPSKDIISFFTFVSFFPQLVAGPIERAVHLLPQFNKKREFSCEKATSGLQQVLWGLFQKAIIADNCAPLVDEAFGNPTGQSAAFLILGAFLFAMQVYGDFAGYSNMAIGIARLLGFDLMQNFNSPYFSQNISEIWRRWHISLSTWLRDYLFTPLAIAVRNWGKWGVAFATLVTFTISGLWHGADWNFILWGFLHGLVISYEILTKKQRKRVRNKLPSWIYNNISIILTFLFWTFALIFFRAANTLGGFVYLKSMFQNEFSIGDIPHHSQVGTIIILIFFFMIIDWWGKDKAYAIENVGRFKNATLRWAVYIILIFIILIFYPSGGTPFIYFQF